MDTFKAFRAAELFSKAEQSWKEIDAYIGSAITLLPPSLQKEAIEEVAKVDQISLKDIKENTTLTDWHQSLMKGFQITGLSYQMFNQKDYDKFQKNYMRTRPEWGIADLGKPGLENSEAVSATLNAQITRQSTTKEKEGIRTVSELKFPFSPELPNVYKPKHGFQTMENKQKYHVLFSANPQYACLKPTGSHSMQIISFPLLQKKPVKE